MPRSRVGVVVGVGLLDQELRRLGLDSELSFLRYVNIINIKLIIQYFTKSGMVYKTMDPFEF